MSGRILVPVVCLALGAGFGVSGSKCLTRETPSAAPSSASPPVAPGTKEATDSADEVVVEIRVRVPAGKPAPGTFGKGASTISQGALVNTQNPLDLAIEGDGFFQLTLPNGDIAYTRDGVFGRNAQGNLVTAHGYLVSPQITVPQNAVSVAVGTDGTVSVQSAGALNASTVLGQFTIATFANPGWLKVDENGFYRETPQAGTPTFCIPGQSASGLLRQGFRERRSEQFSAALIELVRDLAQEKGNNTDGNGVRVRVLGKE